MYCELAFSGMELQNPTCSASFCLAARSAAAVAVEADEAEDEVEAAPENASDVAVLLSEAEETTAAKRPENSARLQGGDLIDFFVSKIFPKLVPKLLPKIFTRICSCLSVLSEITSHI